MKIDRQGASGFFTLQLDKEMEYPQKYWSGFIEDLKVRILALDRSYDPVSQTWHIKIKHYQTVVDLRKQHFEKDQISLFEGNGL